MWSEDAVLEELPPAPTLSQVLECLYRSYAKAKGKEPWGDKSDYMDTLPVINCLFPTAQFVHIIRDGRDVANSVMKLLWGPSDILSAATWWNDHVWLCRRMGAILGPERYTEVRFEDLVERSEDELLRLCDYLGEEYSPQMLQYHNDSAKSIPKERSTQHRNTNAPPNTKRCYAWEREMNKSDVALFQRHAGRMLGEVGYKVEDLAVGKIRMGARLAQIAARRLLSKQSEEVTN